MALTAGEWFQIGLKKIEDGLYEEAINANNQALLYFYISFVNTSEDSGVASEANSAAVKK